MKKKETTISKKTLKMMDGSMKNLAKGKVGKPIPLHTFRQTPAQAKATRKEHLKLVEATQEKKTKKGLQALLKKRGWPKEEIEVAMQELWPKI